MTHCRIRENEGKGNYSHEADCSIGTTVGLVRALTHIVSEIL